MGSNRLWGSLTFTVLLSSSTCVTLYLLAVFRLRRYGGVSVRKASHGIAYFAGKMWLSFGITWVPFMVGALMEYIGQEMHSNAWMIAALLVHCKPAVDAAIVLTLPTVRERVRTIQMNSRSASEIILDNGESFPHLSFSSSSSSNSLNILKHSRRSHVCFIFFSNSNFFSYEILYLTNFFFVKYFSKIHSTSQYENHYIECGEDTWYTETIKAGKTFSFSVEVNKNNSVFWQFSVEQQKCDLFTRDVDFSVDFKTFPKGRRSQGFCDIRMGRSHTNSSACSDIRMGRTFTNCSDLSSECNDYSPLFKELRLREHNGCVVPPQGGLVTFSWSNRHRTCLLQ